MKRTYLQRNTIEDQPNLNMDEENICKFHPAEILLREQHFDTKVVQQFKRFVRINKEFILRIRFSIQLLLIVILLHCLSSCDLFNLGSEKPSKNLTIGIETNVANQTVPISGGTVVVNSPGSEIDGMEITVPANSYPTPKTFILSTAPITDHKLGEYFNPITPLIQIENGSGYSDSIMEITIPIAIADGEIPLGFFYDEITGTLEAIPVKEYTSSSITLLTRHFMPSSALTTSDNTLKADGIKIDATSNMVISSITESILKSKAIISSGYNVGTDDWEFTNYGSYIATGGQCAGQNMCAMWYYFEKKLKGNGNLNGKFSTVDALWQDNAIGYRFCSVIHNDLVWSGTFIDLFDKYIDKNQQMDKFKLYAIAGAILTTGEPQGIGIYRQTGTNTNGTPIYGGHDLICYQVAINEGKLFISDPNKPGVGQEIVFKNDKFEPYVAKLNGNAASNPYPFVTWYAKTAYIDWPQIGKRYAELVDSTIGNNAPNAFPDYTIWVTGTVDKKIKNGYTTDEDTLRCIVECLTAEVSFPYQGKNTIGLMMYDETGAQVNNWKDNVISFTKLKPGLNRLGFYVYGWKNGVKYDNSNTFIPLFIDFKWFNIYYSRLKIDPNPIIGEPDEEIKITALAQGTAPANSKYIWNFGDGSKEETVLNDSIVQHKFTKEGEYVVTVDLYDISTSTLVGHATADADIAKGILSRLQKYQYVSVDFNADIKSNNEIVSFSGLSIDNSPPWGSTQNCPLVWNGTAFSASFDYSWELLSGEKVHSYGTISGTMSASGLIMKTFSAHETSEYPEISDVFKYDISVKDIPYMPDYEYDEYTPRFGTEGSTTGQYVISYAQSWDYVDSDGNAGSLYSTTINYNDPEDEPYIHITFSGEK